jgi:hypothetical protein
LLYLLQNERPQRISKALTVIVRSIALIISLLLGSNLAAFDIDGTKWPGATAEFFVGIDGTSPSGVLWNTAFISAMDEWTQATNFTFTAVPQREDPCRFDAFNGVGFTADVCGSAYGENTLAVTLTRFSTQILGPPRIIRSDIVINSSVNYDVFSGRLVQFGIPSGSIDFRRVALHELGHAMGLDHEESAPAIMAPNISNIDSLQADDIAGVNTLYGGLGNCDIAPLSFGSSANSLSLNDCTVIDLTVGGTDTSFIDVYEFEVEAPTTVSFSVDSPQLDSVLILADRDLNYLDFDDKTSGLCGSTLSTTLAPGSYLLLANTFVEPIKAECGNTGTYSLQASFVSSQLKPLGRPLSLLGTPSAARFFGGVSSDNGLSYGNTFSAASSLNIDANIEIDPFHVGQAGFIVVAALLDEQTLFLDSTGAFVEAPGPFIRAQSLILGSTQQLAIAKALVPAAIGIDNIEVRLFVGYGLEASPEDIFFHQNPLSLVINP